MTVVRPLVTVVCLAALLGVSACGGEESSPPTTTVSGPAGSPSGPEATTTEPTGPAVTIETASGDEVVVPVEVADTPKKREVGLMNRTSLPEDAGMIFLFDEDSSLGFWMKDTLIPLSIAFAAADGTIVRILDMEPCEADPCEIYDPGVPYRSALEVNQGAFSRWGVAEGDVLTLQS
jgi:uncharacterized membrane protein (UPF0127 family)